MGRWLQLGVDSGCRRLRTTVLQQISSAKWSVIVCMMFLLFMNNIHFVYISCVHMHTNTHAHMYSNEATYICIYTHLCTQRSISLRHITGQVIVLQLRLRLPHTTHTESIVRLCADQKRLAMYWSNETTSQWAHAGGIPKWLQTCRSYLGASKRLRRNSWR